MEAERRHITGQARAGVLEGICMRYGAVGYDPVRRQPEVFSSRALSVPESLGLTREHVDLRPLRVLRSRHFTNDDTALRVRCKVPGLSRGPVGLSVEFVPLHERELHGVRQIESARLVGLSVTSSPAHPQSQAEVRRGRGLRGAYAYGQLKTVRDRGSVRKTRVASGAFKYGIDRVEQFNVDLRLGHRATGSNVLADTKSGSLEVKDTEAALTFSVAALPDTAAATDARALMDAEQLAVDVMYSIPPGVSGAVSLTPEAGNEEVMIEEVRQAVLRSIVLTARAPAGMEPGGVQSRRAAALWL